MSRELYFAYGSNMDQDQMRQRCPDCRRKLVARVDDSWVCFPRSNASRDGGVASIEKSCGRRLWGVVYSLTPQDLRGLDRCEGFVVKRPLVDRRNSYYRSKIEVTDTINRIHKVWTYFAIPGKAARPSRNYRDQLVRGAQQHTGIGMPKAHIEALREIKAKGER